MECSGCSIEGNIVPSVAFAVRVEQIRSVDFAVETKRGLCRPMEDMPDVLCRTKIFDNITEIAEVFVRWAAALGSSEGDGGHIIQTAFGEIEEDPEETKVGIMVGWLGRRIGILGKRWIGWLGLCAESLRGG